MNSQPPPSTVRPDLLPDEISDELKHVLRRRLLALAESLPDEDRNAFRRRIPEHLALPVVASVMAPTFSEVARARIALRGRFERYPLAAALAQMLEETSPYRPAHDRLLAWTTYASLSLLQQNLKFQDAISRGLADCRLLAQLKSEQELLLTVSPDIYETRGLVQALVAMKSHVRATPNSDRHADAIRVVIDYFQKNVAPIKRLRGAAMTRHYISQSVSEPTTGGHLEDDPIVEEVVTAITEVVTSDWREDDSGEASTLVRAKPTGGFREKRIEAIQRSRAQGFVNALAIRGHRLPSHWDHATDHEIREAIRVARERMHPGSCDNWQDYLGVMLVIALGRPPDAIRGIFSPKARTKYSGYLVSAWKGRWSLEFKPDIPVRKKIGEAERSVFRPGAAEHVQIFLPELLTAPLSALYPMIGEPEVMPDPAAVTSELSKGLARPVSLLRLSRVLRDRLEVKVEDNSLAGLLVGRSVKNLTSLYYTAHQIQHLQEPYDQVMGELFGGDQRMKVASSEEVGTPNRYLRGAVRALYEQTNTALARARTALWPAQVEFHNLFTLYTYLVLSLATGHRPVRNPFENVKDFDLVRGVVYIGDKHNKAGPNFRIVPLAPTAALQVEAWQRHLTYISECWRLTQPDVAHAAQRALKGEGDPSTFLFFIDPDVEANGEVEIFRPVSIAPSDLQERLKNIWPVKENWARHHMRTQLARKLPDELLDAFMGHGAIGGEPLIRESGLAMGDLAALRDAVEAVLKDMWVEATDGLG